MAIPAIIKYFVIPAILLVAAYFIWNSFLRKRYDCDSDGICLLSSGGQYTTSVCDYECSPPSPVPSICLTSTDDDAKDYPWTCDRKTGCKKSTEKQNCNKTSKEQGDDNYPKNKTWKADNYFASEDLCNGYCSEYLGDVYECNTDSESAPTCIKQEKTAYDSGLNYDKQSKCDDKCGKCDGDDEIIDEANGHCCAPEGMSYNNEYCSKYSDKNFCKGADKPCCWISKDKSCPEGCNATSNASTGTKEGCGSESNNWCRLALTEDKCTSSSNHDGHQWKHCCSWGTHCGTGANSDTCNNTSGTDS